MEIFGNTTGLAPSTLRALERIYRRRVPFDVLTTPELSRSLCAASFETGRQVGVLIDRQGQVHHVVVGDASKLVLPDLGRIRAASGRFRGLRLVHTHLRNEPLTRDDLVDLTRLRLDMVAAICLSPEGAPWQIYYAHNVPTDPAHSKDSYQKYGPVAYANLNCNPAEIVVELESTFAASQRLRPVLAKEGRAILVHVSDKRRAVHSEESLRELSELARSADVEVADTVLQIRDQVDPKYVLGRGKLEEVVIAAIEQDCEVLIFDCNLRPAQAHAIALFTDLKVLDRTQLILDIFAQRAESRDGKLQVELAQMKYLLPRLGLRDDSLSRLTGGIGGRGPGETKLEIGRRRANERVSQLESELKKLAAQRKQRRVKRSRRGVPIVAIVGYTNAGKSTLLNALTKSDVVAENKLFATLDPRSRRLRFPEEREVVITDTVGFIRDLPKDLFAAFRATFEETADADLILEVIDIADPTFAEHMKTTAQLLKELRLDSIQRIAVLNKADAVDALFARTVAHSRNGILVSALDPHTFAPLLECMERALFIST